MGPRKKGGVPAPAAQIAKKLSQKFNPERIILFGSGARGQSQAGSDIDLLVVMPFRGSRRRKRVEMRLAARGVGRPVDIVLVTPAEFEERKLIPGTIVRPAVLEGIELHGQ